MPPPAFPRIPFAFLVAISVGTSAWAEWSWSGERLGPVRWSSSVETREGVTLMGTPGWALRTMDGDQFTPVNVPLDFTVHAMASSLQSGLVLAVGENGAIARSVDDGRTWLQVRPRVRGAGHLRAVVWRDSVKRWMVLGDSGRVMESTDGRVWSPGPQIPDPRSVRRVVVLDGDLWAFHDRGVVSLPALRRLAPKGTSWTVAFPEEWNPIDIAARSDGLVLFVGQDSARFTYDRAFDDWDFGFSYYRGGSNRGWRMQGSRSFLAALALDGSLHAWTDNGNIKYTGSATRWLEPDEDSLQTIVEGADFLVAAGNSGRLHSAAYSSAGTLPRWDRRDPPASARTFVVERRGDRQIVSGGRGLATTNDPVDLERPMRDAFPGRATLATWNGRSWIAPIDSGLVLVSRDGESWRRAETGTTVQFRDFAHGLGKTVIALDDGRLLVSSDDSIFAISRQVPRVERFQAFAWTGSQFLGSYLDGTLCASSDLDSWKCVGPNPSLVPQRIVPAGGILLGRSRNFELIASSLQGFQWTKVDAPGPPVREIAVDGDSIWMLHDDRTTSFRRTSDTAWTAGPTVPWGSVQQVTEFEVVGGRLVVGVFVPRQGGHRHGTLKWSQPSPSRIDPRPAGRHSAIRWTFEGDRVQAASSLIRGAWTMELRTPDGRILSRTTGDGPSAEAVLPRASGANMVLAILRTHEGTWSRILAVP